MALRLQGSQEAVELLGFKYYAVSLSCGSFLNEVNVQENTSQVKGTSNLSALLLNYLCPFKMDSMKKALATYSTLHFFPDLLSPGQKFQDT